MRTTTDYKLAGPKTFRRSSKKVLKYWGGNLQNIENSMREIYIPDGFSQENWEKASYWLQTGDLSIFKEEELATWRVFLQVDQSGAEALIVAYDSEFYDYRKLFIHNVKVHVYVALKLFKEEWKVKVREHSLGITPETIEELYITPIEKLREHKDWKSLDKLIKESDNWNFSERYYYFAKQTVHSSNYGIEWATFIMNILDKSRGKIVLTKEQGTTFLQICRALFPEIVERCNRITRQAKECKLIYNMLGFPYQITDYEINSSRYKELWAWGPQSTVGEITRIAFTNLQEYIESEKKKWDILADTHDSYLAQCPLMEIKDCSNKMQEFMNIKLVSPIDGSNFNMKSECNIGFNWSKCKKDNNAIGMQEIRY